MFLWLYRVIPFSQGLYELVFSMVFLQHLEGVVHHCQINVHFGYVLVSCVFTT